MVIFDGEEYFPVPGWEDLYLVSKKGKFLSKKRRTGARWPSYWDKLAVHPTTTGYLQVCFTKNNKTKYYKVHRIVLMTFNPVPNMGKLQVNHKDFNRKNNKLSNLEWVTRQKNVNHAYDAGRVGNNGLKISKKVMKQISFLVDNGFGQRQIARMFNLTCHKRVKSIAKRYKEINKEEVK